MLPLLAPPFSSLILQRLHMSSPDYVVLEAETGKAGLSPEDLGRVTLLSLTGDCYLELFPLPVSKRGTMRTGLVDRGRSASPSV